MSIPPLPRERPQRNGLIEHVAAHATALLIIDMVSCWKFRDGATLVRQAMGVAPAIAALKRRCADARVPVIYANDNSGQWRSDFKFVIRESLEVAGPGSAITQQLEPGEDDYFVLKPKHSAFFATPLEILLDHLKTRRLIMTGVASDQCVMNSVVDARMRDFDVVVPSDCIATLTAARNRLAVSHFEQVLGVKTTRGRSVRLRATPR